jgi:hypothetical protein
MNRKSCGVLLAALAVLGATGCNLGARESSAEKQTVEEAAVRTAVFQTQFAEETAIRRTADAALPSVTPTQAPPTATSTQTLSPTPGKVSITVSKDTNCRSGPDVQFDVIGVMRVGETAEAVGRNADSTYWVIRLPSATAASCWLLGQWATVDGNGQTLPVLESPPTPTYHPQPDLALTYLGLSVCAPQSALRVRVWNAGNVALESVRLIIEDITEGATLTHTADFFRRYDGCSVGGDVDPLEPGETVVISNRNPGQFTYSPSGHYLHVSVRVCTEDGLAGICAESDFYVTV